MVSEQDILAGIEESMALLRESYGYTTTKILSLINELQIPVSVFATSLSPLQAIVTYLHDSEKKSFNFIANNLGRSYRSIWGAYVKEGISIKKSEYSLSLGVFHDGYSILESVVKYLREQESLKFSQIAKLLQKDQRTIWTVYKRAQKKDEA